MGVYGNHYLQRAYISLVRLGAAPAEDAIYPLLFADADGDPLTGDTDYVMHFGQPLRFCQTGGWIPSRPTSWTRAARHTVQTSVAMAASDQS